MKKNLTEIILIIDSSGSMQRIKDDTEGGLKTFLDSQRKKPGECNVTYYRFASTVEKIFENKNIKNVKDIEIKPSGWTALYDALGRAIDETGERLSKTKEKDRPELILVCVISDGFENYSKKFSAKDIREKIQHQEEKYSWQFTYLGTNQDAFLVGQELGFQAGKSMTYKASRDGIHNAFCSLDLATSTMRDAPIAASSYAFSTSDREEAVK